MHRCSMAVLLEGGSCLLSGFHSSNPTASDTTAAPSCVLRPAWSSQHDAHRRKLTDIIASDIATAAGVTIPIVGFVLRARCGGVDRAVAMCPDGSCNKPVSKINTGDMATARTLFSAVKVNSIMHPESGQPQAQLQLQQQCMSRRQ